MPGPRGLVQLLDQRLHRSDFPRAAVLLVAVSGGADSVALLRLLVEINRSSYWGWKLVVGHVDHGLRGAPSHGDARFVAKLAETLGLPCLQQRLKLPRKSSEDTARQARLAALAAMAKQSGSAAVVMAHHADDQAETVLMRLFRGTGMEGLSGMAARAEMSVGAACLTIVRPLLEVRRDELRKCLRALGQTWREDATNATDLYLRNRIRRQLMPRIERLAPAAVDALGRVAVLAGQAQAAIQVAAREFMDQTPAWGTRRHVQLPRADLLRLPMAVASEVLRRIIAALGGSPETADFERLQAALQMIRLGHGGKEVQVGGGITLALRDGMVRIQRSAAIGGRRS